MKVEVNPEVLVWARSTAGLDVDEAARLLGFRDTKRRTAAEGLASLESGADDPSFSVLDRMAARYHRPVLAFYLERVPEEEESAARFRSAPGDLTARDAGLLDAFVRRMRERQQLLREALEDGGEDDLVAWVGSAEVGDGLEVLAPRVRRLVGLDLAEFRARPDARTAFALLRQGAQAAGAAVLIEGDLGSRHTALDVRVFRGLSLADPVAPFVVVNPSDADVAWSFTLLHELTHLVLGQSEFVSLKSDDRIERLCNDVAGELLVPTEDLQELGSIRALDRDRLADRISSLARKWRVSSSMVAYRAERVGIIRRAALFSLLDLFERRWRAGKKARRPGGPSFYTMRRHRLGRALLRRTRRLWRRGALSTTEAGAILGVRGRNVHALLETSDA